jgi:intracellular multiplication protein IcmL
MSIDNSAQNDDPIVMIYLRNEFYKKKFFSVLIVFILNLIGVAVLSWMLAYLIENPPHPLYFAADTAGRLIKEIPLSEPSMTVEEVTAWAVEAVQAAYSYDYINYRAELQRAQRYFTDYGWRKYMEGLTKSNNLVALTQRSFIQIGTIVQQPQLITQGHMGTVYAYQFRIPVLMTYWGPPYDESTKIYNPLIVTLTIQRRNVFESYKGLGIIQMNAELVTTGGGA